MPSITGFTTAEIAVGGAPLTVAVADTTELRRQGLMGVEELPAGINGMLFVFDPPRAAVFHMRNTPMPLDVWWFHLDGTLIDTDEMEPCLLESCQRYPSPDVVTWVLETPQGRYDFSPGNTLSVG